MMPQPTLAQEALRQIHRPPVDPLQDEAGSLLLDEHGLIVECDEPGEHLFGYACRDLAERHISMLLPDLENACFLKDGEINPILLFCCRIGTRFLVVCADGSLFTGRISLIDLGKRHDYRIRLIVHRAE